MKPGASTLKKGLVELGPFQYVPLQSGTRYRMLLGSAVILIKKWTEDPTH